FRLDLQYGVDPSDDGAAFFLIRIGNERHGRQARPAAAHDDDERLARALAYQPDGMVYVPHLAAVDAQDLVPRVESGPLGRAAGGDAPDLRRDLRLEAGESEGAQEIPVEVGGRENGQIELAHCPLAATVAHLQFDDPLLHRGFQQRPARVLPGGDGFIT